MQSLSTGMTPEGFIDIMEIARRIGVGKTSAWKIARSDATFPRKFKFGYKCSRWREEEIEEWISMRVAAAEEAGAGMRR